MITEPYITVGIMDRQSTVSGRLDGDFLGDGFGPVPGPFSARVMTGLVVLLDGTDREIVRAPLIHLRADSDSMFRLSKVTIGKDFHWQRREDQVFRGDLILRARKDGTMAAVNAIPLEDYLVSVISSEMSAAAPPEFLKAHAIISRSWLLSALERKKTMGQSSARPGPSVKDETEVRRWYDREDHDIYDVCADDHCQRYQGITKIISAEAKVVVRETRGMVLAYQGQICDTRYYKACGGLTEDFETAWEDMRVPYLTSVSDAPVIHRPIMTEDDAAQWILSAPEAYCNTQDEGILRQILPDFDRETKGFFRWTVDYSREELEEILRERSGLDFGTLMEIVPLQRGPSGRIFRLKIVGSKRSVVVGKELEIRRWLSRSHLYSSAFVVTAKCAPEGSVERFTLHGAGWGHGVGLCQIGAAVMATKGFTAGQILEHYFRGTEIEKTY
jgi:stage II sporulation protein D